MIVAVSGISCLVSSCNTSHFGKNPVIGGSPPSDSIVIIIITVRMGVFVQFVLSALIFVADTVFSAMKAVDVIVI